MKVIGEVQTFASGFTKREFVVEVEDGNYPQSIKFECLKDKTSLTDSLSGGDPAKVNFDIRGIEYYGKYYVNLNAWRIEKSGGGGAPPAEEGFASESPPSHLSEPPAGHGNESDDDIPF